MNNRSLLVGMVVLILIPKLLAQSPQIYSEINVVPPSPNVASLNKFIDVPVSHYTGIPSIGIPIYTIELPQLQLPISLNYHAGGLRVEDHASWVGAGWSLSAGGSISRTLHGIPDESDVYSKWGWLSSRASSLFNGSGAVLGDSIFSCYSTASELGSSWGDIPYIRADTLARGWIDSEPDVFHYSVPGGGGKFIFNRNKQVYKLDTDNFTISTHPFQSSSLPNYPTEADYSWEIIGPDGVTYEFTKPEKTFVQSDCGSMDTPYGGSGLDEYQSSWYLTKMSLNGDSIVFDYVAETLTYDQRISSSLNFKVIGSGTPPSGGHCYNTTTVSAWRLSKITASNGITIDFLVQETGTRSDLTGSKKLERINISKGSNYIRGYALDTDSYFGTSSNKLKLSSVVPIDENGNTENGYVFEYYNEGSVPSVSSKSQDYWGFHNFSSSNSSLIPEYKDTNYHYNRTSGANRTPSLSGTQSGALKKLIYPTGGHTLLEYELNSRYNANKLKTYIHSVEVNGTSVSPDEQYSSTFIVGQNCSATIDLELEGPAGEDYWAYLETSTGSIVTLSPVVSGNRLVLPSGTYRLHAYNSDDNSTSKITIEYEQVEPGEETIGGLRIKKVTNSAGIEKRYLYTYDNGQSSGRLFSPLSFAGVLQTNYPGAINGLVCEESGTSLSWINVSDKSQLPGIAFEGSHIGYSRVRELGLDPATNRRNGLTEYEFTNEAVSLNTGYPIVPSPDISHKNGKIKRQTIYKTLVFEKDTTILGLPDVVDSLADIKIKSTIYGYNEYTLSASPIKAYKVGKKNTRFCFRCSDTITDDFSLNLFEYHRKWYALSSVKEIGYEDSDSLISLMTYHYGDSLNHTFPTTEKQYFDGFTHNSYYTRHSTNPALVIQLAVHKTTGLTSSQLAGTQLTYHGMLPLSVKKWNRESNSYALEVQNSFEDNRLITRKRFFGNGTSSGLEIEENYLWGYQNTYPVAVIQNATRGEVLFGLSAADLSNLQSGVKVESIINGLRNTLDHASVRTLVWDPSFGVIKEIDENNLSVNYSYDSFGRLKEIRDHNNNVLNRYQYQFISIN